MYSQIHEKAKVKKGMKTKALCTGTSIILSAFESLHPATALPPFGYEASSNGRCYRLIYPWQTLQATLDECAAEGAELAGFRTEEEYKGITEMMAKC